jgi:hypothetical protein
MGVPTRPRPVRGGQAGSLKELGGKAVPRAGAAKKGGNRLSWILAALIVIAIFLIAMSIIGWLINRVR